MVWWSAAPPRQKLGRAEAPQRLSTLEAHSFSKFSQEPALSRVQGAVACRLPQRQAAWALEHAEGIGLSPAPAAATRVAKPGAKPSGSRARRRTLRARAHLVGPHPPAATAC